jgi:hypothetical protein
MGTGGPARSGDPSERRPASFPSAEGSRAVLPTSFQRDVGSKAAGCLVYALVAPMLAFVVALILSFPVSYLLTSLGVSEERAKYAFPILLPAIAVGACAQGAREYRQRAAQSVLIDWERIVIGRGTRARTVAFSDVTRVRVVPGRLAMTCVLEGSFGKPLPLPADLAPFSLVREALEAALIPRLSRELDERLRNGESVAIRESRPGAILRIVRGLGVVLLSVTLKGKSAVLSHGLLLVRHGWLGRRGGFVVRWQGLCPRSGDERDLVPWDELERLRHDQVGLVFRSRGGQIFAASPYAADYFVCSAWLAA